uniref:FLYWCH-type domain-containing protein n=1 Tax=Meloidogyne hapla TaxID=6305 RepID=A0A1I8C165_MELHA
MNISIILFLFLFVKAIIAPRRKKDEISSKGEGTQEQTHENPYSQKTETERQANVIKLLKKLSNWIVDDIKNNKYEIDMKYITVDDEGENFICEVCKLAELEYAPKYSVDYTNVKSNVIKHLRTSPKHAKAIKFHYTTSKREGEILNYGGYSYNKDSESKSKGIITYRCRQTYREKNKCHGRAKTEKGIFQITNNHVCDSPYYFNVIQNQVSQLTQEQEPSLPSQQFPPFQGGNNIMSLTNSPTTLKG